MNDAFNFSFQTLIVEEALLVLFDLLFTEALAFEFEDHFREVFSNDCFCDSNFVLEDD